VAQASRYSSRHGARQVVPGDGGRLEPAGVRVDRHTGAPCINVTNVGVTRMVRPQGAADPGQVAALQPAVLASPRRSRRQLVAGAGSRARRLEQLGAERLDVGRGCDHVRPVAAEALRHQLDSYPARDHGLTGQRPAPPVPPLMTLDTVAMDTPAARQSRSSPWCDTPSITLDNDRDVAAQAGVSIATVSKVINAGTGGAGTLARVQA